jgi:hypothetical protein
VCCSSRDCERLRSAVDTLALDDDRGCWSAAASEAEKRSSVVERRPDPIAHETPASLVNGRAPPSSDFAAYVAYEAKIPTERSPLSGESVSQVLGGGAAMLGYLEGEPLLVIVGIVGILVIRIVTRIGDGIGSAIADPMEIALKRKIAKLLGVELEERDRE